MARRRNSETIARALSELSVAVSRARDIPFVFDRCPICDGHISQSQSGERHPLRHFDCAGCGWWMIIDAEEIRGAITGPPVRMATTWRAGQTGASGLIPRLEN